MKPEKNEIGLVINIPTYLKNQIDSLFSTSTQTQINKVLFLIFKICKEKKYQLNVKNHADMLGINTGKLTSILSILKKNNIIQTNGDYRIGAVSNSYTLINSYNCEDENNYKLYFYPGRTKVPTWVQQYITDGYTVVAKEFSKFRNNIKNQAELTYEEQAKLIQQLQGENKRLQAQLATLRASIGGDDEVIAMGKTTPVKPLFTPAKSENKYSSVSMCEAHSNTDDTLIISENGVTVTVTNAEKLICYLSNTTEKSENFIKNRIVGCDLKRQLVINDCYNNNHMIYGVKTMVGDSYFFEVTRI